MKQPLISYVWLAVGLACAGIAYWLYSEDVLDWRYRLAIGGAIIAETLWLRHGRVVFAMNRRRYIARAVLYLLIAGALITAAVGSIESVHPLWLVIASAPFFVRETRNKFRESLAGMAYYPEDSTEPPFDPSQWNPDDPRFLWYLTQREQQRQQWQQQQQQRPPGRR